MKRLLFFSVMLFAALAAQGQRFEWAKGYDSGYEDAYIKGTVTDSLGNLYILGQIHYDSDWGNEWLMPYLTTTNTMVLVAKISPDGEMVWRKMFGNTKNSTFSQDIKPIGDTGFAVIFQECSILPGWGDLGFWMDSAYSTVYHPLISPYDTPGYRFGDASHNVYLKFDFNGNVLEQHILQVSYVDNYGNNIVDRPYFHPDSLSWLWVTNMTEVSFDFDLDGNIYICRMADDAVSDYSSYNGTIKKVRYWVDHKFVGESDVENNPHWCIPHLLKFSPHFDTLLSNRYVIQRLIRDGDGEECHTWFDLKFDKKQNKLYTMYLLLASNSSYTHIIDSMSNMILHQPPYSPYKSAVVVFDSVLIPNGFIAFSDSIINSSNSHNASTLWSDLAIDNDSNLLAVNGGVGVINAIFTYNNNIVPLNSRAVVLLFDKNDYTLHSVLEFPSTGYSDIPVNKGSGDLVLKKNRVFLQAPYKNGIRLPSGQYYVQGSTNSGLALAVWDYQGNLIDGRDYHTYSQKHNPGPIALVDSTLYLVNQLCANATFGDQTFYASNSYMACIAKYVDTAFMSVYRPPVGGISSGAESVDYSFYPNPVENLLHVDLEGENILSASAISVLGIKDNLEVVGDAVDVSHLQPGIYIMELTTTHNTYNFKFIKR